MSSTNENPSVAKNVINWYPGHMAKTKRLIKENIDLIDIVYEVVDARIPFSSKIPNINEFISDKPRIMIFTKIDLCDLNETKRWISYYENQGYKVLALDLEHDFNMSKLFNATDEIMSKINNIRKTQGLLSKKAHVLVVGVPNVGKSTLINRLVHKKVVNVGNRPGVTKDLNWIRINDSIDLLDSPGILWPKLDNEIVSLNLASFTAIKEEILPLYDITQYILKMLEKYYPEKLEARYKIQKLSDDFYETLEIIGKKRGCLLKGGKIDYDKVVSLVLQDIKEGVIKGVTFDRL